MNQVYFQIDVYSHHFVVSDIAYNGRNIVNDFLNKFKHWDMGRENGRYVRIVKALYATHTPDHNQYRFHIGTFKAFVEALRERRIPEYAWPVRTHTPTVFEPIELELRDGWTTREKQLPAVAYLDEPLPEHKLLEIQPGSGKSYLGTNDAVKKKQRIVIIVKAQFVLKWVADVQKIANVKPHEIMLVAGKPDKKYHNASLIKLIALAQQGQLDDIKVFVISNSLMRNWLSEYHRVGAHGLEMQGYGCAPEDFFQTLKVGYRLIDEVHMDFHLNFLLDLYTHVKYATSLSATLVSDDPFVKKMQEIAYPKEERFKDAVYNRYIHSYSWRYHFKNPKTIRTTEFGQTKYSHTAFEKSLLKQNKATQDYLDMVYDSIRQSYLREYQPGDKLLVYFASINMCHIAAKYLKSKFKDKKVNSYVTGDPKGNLYESDIVTSTLGSAGTGHDIAGLTTVILTLSLASTSGNIQGSGRLREITGRNVRFVYFVCVDFPKHLEYHEKKKDILREIAKSYTGLTYQNWVG